MNPFISGVVDAIQYIPQYQLYSIGTAWNHLGICSVERKQFCVSRLPWYHDCDYFGYKCHTFYRFIVIDYFLGSWENVAHVARKAGHGSSISHFLNSPLTKRSVNLEAHNALLLITAHSLASLGIEIEATLGVKATH